jgi:hypothetical protein
MGKVQLEMRRKPFTPGIKIVSEHGHLAKRQVVWCCCWVYLLQNLGQNSGCSKQRQGPRQARAFPRQSWLEASLSHILVIGICGEFRMHILFAKQLRKAKNGSSKARTSQVSTDVFAEHM